MIDSFVDQWEERKGVLRERLEETHPRSYQDLVEWLVGDVLVMPPEDRHMELSSDRIYRIDDGDYQGTEIYLIGFSNYQPGAHDYVWFPNGYGSCSGCDTMEDIKSFHRENPPSSDQVDQYLKLALHMVQRMKFLSDRPW